MPTDVWQTLMLSDAALAWIRGAFAVTARVDDVSVAYQFHHEFNLGQRRETAWFSTEPSNCLGWTVKFHDAAGGERATATRGIIAGVPLRERDRFGRVASRDMLRVSPTRQGFARDLTAAEERLFRSWNVDEIHLEAVDDGLIAWGHMGFLPYDEHLFLERWEEWAGANGQSPAPKPRWEDYPEAFLRWLERLFMYMVL